MRIHKKKVEVIDQYDYIRINSLLIDFLVFLISRPFWVLNIALVLVDIPPQWMQCLNKFFNGWSWDHTHPLHSSLDQYEVLPQYPSEGYVAPSNLWNRSLKPLFSGDSGSILSLHYFYSLRIELQYSCFSVIQFHKLWCLLPQF